MKNLSVEKINRYCSTVLFGNWTREMSRGITIILEDDYLLFIFLNG